MSPNRYIQYIFMLPNIYSLRLNICWVYLLGNINIYWVYLLGNINVYWAYLLDNINIYWVYLLGNINIYWVYLLSNMNIYWVYLLSNINIYWVCRYVYWTTLMSIVCITVVQHTCIIPTRSHVLGNTIGYMCWVTRIYVGQHLDNIHNVLSNIYTQYINTVTQHI